MASSGQLDKYALLEIAGVESGKGAGAGGAGNTNGHAAKTKPKYKCSSTTVKVVGTSSTVPPPGKRKKSAAGGETVGTNQNSAKKTTKNKAPVVEVVGASSKTSSANTEVNKKRVEKEAFAKIMEYADQAKEILLYFEKRLDTDSNLLVHPIFKFVIEFLDRVNMHPRYRWYMEQLVNDATSPLGVSIGQRLDTGNCVAAAYSQDTTVPTITVSNTVPPAILDLENNQNIGSADPPAIKLGSESNQIIGSAPPPPVLSVPGTNSSSSSQNRFQPLILSTPKSSPRLTTGLISGIFSGKLETILSGNNPLTRDMELRSPIVLVTSILKIQKEEHSSSNEKSHTNTAKRVQVRINYMDGDNGIAPATLDCTISNIGDVLHEGMMIQLVSYKPYLYNMTGNHWRACMIIKRFVVIKIYDGKSRLIPADRNDLASYRLCEGPPDAIKSSRAVETVVATAVGAAYQPVCSPSILPIQCDGSQCSLYSCHFTRCIALMHAPKEVDLGGIVNCFPFRVSLLSRMGNEKKRNLLYW
jgi:hypothetical protein